MPVRNYTLGRWNGVSSTPFKNRPLLFLILMAAVLVAGFAPAYGSAEGSPPAPATNVGDAGLPSDIPSYILEILPEDATLDPATGIFTWIHAHGEALRLVVVGTDDGTGGWDFQFADMDMRNATANAPPVIFPISDLTADELATINVTVSAIDPDGPDGALRYSLEGTGPDGDAIDPATGEYRWTPTESQGGAYHFVTIKVTDGYGTSSHEVFGIGVNEVNTAPYLDGMPRLGTDEHSLLTFPVSAFDPDLPANILTYRLSGAPPGAAINRIDNTSGNFTWTPHEGQDGSISFVIVVSDGEGGLFGRPVTVDVREVNETPTLGKMPAQRICANSTLAFSVVGHDPDLPANTLTYSLVDAPPGATISSEDGAGGFLWTPHASQVGTHLIAVVVSDGMVSADPQIIIIRVCPAPNTPPTFDEISRQDVYEHSLLSLTANATDPDGPDSGLMYSLTIVGPDGATIDPVTGLYEWPVESRDGSYQFVLIRVTDDRGASDYRAFAIRVLETSMLQH